MKVRHQVEMVPDLIMFSRNGSQGFLLLLMSSEKGVEVGEVDVDFAGDYDNYIMLLANSEIRNLPLAFVALSNLL